MNELQIFENSEFGSVRTVEIHNEPWFVASDIAKALGYRMASDMTRRIDEEDKGTHSVSTPSGEQNMTVINESGLYSAILESKLPNAKKFKHWVTGEVLPSIRKTGAYVANVPSTELSPETQLILQLAQSIAQKEIADKERDRRLDSLEESNQSIKEAVKPITDNWREEINSKFNRIQRGSDKPFNVLRTEMYTELEHRAGCDLGTRLRNKQVRMRDNGRTKTEITNLNKMDIIEEDKRLKEIFSKIVSEYEIQYCA